MNTPYVQPYLFLAGRCEEAVEFYQSAIGASVDMMLRFADSPEPMQNLPEGYESKIMHTSFRVGECVIMASDGCGETDPISGFGLSISVATEDEVDTMLSALTDGGEMIMPADKTFWCPRFGMAKDKFGVLWMVGVHVDTPA